MTVDDPTTAAARAMAHADGNRWHDEPAEGAFPLPLANPMWWTGMAKRALTAAALATVPTEDPGPKLLLAALLSAHGRGRRGEIEPPDEEEAATLLASLDTIRPGRIAGDPEKARAAGQRIVDACIEATVEGRSAIVGSDIRGEDLGTVAIACGGRA